MVLIKLFVKIYCCDIKVEVQKTIQLSATHQIENTGDGVLLATKTYGKATIHRLGYLANMGSLDWSDLLFLATNKMVNDYIRVLVTITCVPP